MDKQIRDISKKRTWKRILRRSVALLCAVVMLFTMNTLKRNADTLEHIPMCGYAEHVHSASCFSGDVLVCGMEEHIHTDACYQTRPSDDVEVLTIDSDEDIPVEEVDVELGDLVLDVDVGDLVLDEPGALTVNESAPTEEEKYFILSESAKVSTIIKELELGIKRKQIEAVGAIENDEEHIGLIRVDALEKDWLVSAAKDFDEAELAIVLADDIVVVKLKDGRVSEDLDTPVEEQVDIEAPAVDEQIEQTVVDEQEPVIEEQPIEVKQIEVPSVEEPAQPAEVQAQPAEDEMPVEETVPAEEASPEEEQTTEEAPPAEEQLTEESAPVEGEQSDEESAPVEEQPVEAELSTDDEQQPAEDAEVTAEETAPAEGAEALAELPTDDEQYGYEQPVVPAEEQGEEITLTEEQGEVDEDAVPTEEQGEDGQQPEVVAPVDEEQGEDDAPAEEHGESAEKSEEDMQPEGTASVDEEQGEEGVQSEEVAPTGEQGEGAQQTEEAKPVGEEQSEDAAPAEENEETTPAEEQGEDAQQAEETAPVDEEQTEDAAPGEDYEEAEAEEGQSEEQGEQQPEGQGEDAEQSEEAEAEEGQSEEQGEQQPEGQGEDAEQSEEVEAEEGQSEEQGEQLPDEQGGDAEQLEEGEAEEGQLEEQNGQQPDEQGEDAEQSEEAEAEEGQPEEQGEQQPEAQTYTATIDLTDVETYPLSLNAMLTAATPEQEEIEEEAIDGEAQEDQAEEQTTLTIEYDEALLEVVEQDGDYLVTPIQSFESTQIIVNNGSRYELTLVNCVLATDEKVEDEGEQQEEAQDVPAYTATIDLTDATYPLSLNEMITAATPEQGDYEEAQEDQAEEQPEEQPTLTIEYDEALLEVVEQDGDYLVRPVQSFESTQIIVTNGSRYELTLVNCVLKAEEQEEQSVPVHTATIDLTNATYPLSLNELITGVAPEQAESEQPEEQPEIEQSEAQNEQQVEEQPTLTIDYDEALLEIVESDGDWLVTPVQSFESTQITVTNGSRYELTLVNCVLTEEEQEEQEVIYPAKTFEGHTDYVKVSVTAPEGAFPEGTTMTVADVEDEQTITDIEETVSEDFVEVKRVHAVDISFFNSDGVEIEPLVPISVVMTVQEIEQQQDAVVVHVDQEGATEVVDSQSEAPAGETEVTMEMPASSSADEGQEEQGEQEPQPTEEQQEGESRAFTADSFSVYAVVVTETIETRYIDAEGAAWKISVGYGEDAKIPTGATLKVAEVTDETYLTEAEAALDAGKRVTMARFFDISIVDSEGAEVQPAVPVTVNISLDNTEVESIEAAEHVIDNSDPVAVAMHFEESDGETTVDVKETEQTEEAVVFDAASFSVWGVVYTVDFYYGDYEYHIEGESSVTLGALFEALEIEADAVQAADVVFSNPELVAVERLEDGSVWTLTSLEPFDTEEELTVTMEDGTIYEIRVEDAQYDYWALVSDDAMGYFTGGSNNILQYSQNAQSYSYIINDSVRTSNGQIVEFKVPVGGKGYGFSATCREGNRDFAFWLKIKDGVNKRIDGSTLGSNRGDVGDATFIAYFGHTWDNLVVVEDTANGSVTVADSTNGNQFRYPRGNTTLPKYTYLYGDITLTASPNSGYKFMGWYSNNTLVSSNSTLTASDITEDMYLTPVFEELYSFTYKVNNTTVGQYYATFASNSSSNGYYSTHSGKGVLSDDGNYCMVWENAEASVKSGYENDYRFACWLRDDGSRPTTMNEGKLLRGKISRVAAYPMLEYDNTTYIAFFTPANARLVVAVADDNGSVSGGTRFESTSLYYGYTNADVTFTATPNSGYVFKGWYNESGERISLNSSYTVKAGSISADTKLTARFASDYEFSLITNINDTVDFYNYYNAYQGTAPYTRNSYSSAHNLQHYFKAIPGANNNNRYVYWLKDDGSSPRTSENIYLRGDQTIDRDTTFIAWFAPAGEYIVRVLEPDDPAMGSATYNNCRTVTTNTSDFVFKYYFSSDNATITATPTEGYMFTGWYNGTELISTNPSYPITYALKNMELKPVFTQTYVANVVSNGAEYGGYFQSSQFKTNGAEDQFTEKSNIPTRIVSGEAYTKLVADIKQRCSNSANAFIGWLRDDGTTPVVKDNGNLNNENFLYRDTTFVGFFGPKDAKLVRVLPPETGTGSIATGGSDAIKMITVDSSTWYYYFSTDNAELTATELYKNYTFVGWYVDGVCVSRDKVLSIIDDLPETDANIVTLEARFRQFYTFDAELYAEGENKANIINDVGFMTSSDTYTETGDEETGLSVEGNKDGYFNDERTSATGLKAVHDDSKTDANLIYPITPEVKETAEEGYRFAYWVAKQNNAVISSTASLTPSTTVPGDGVTFYGLFAKGYIIRLNNSVCRDYTDLETQVVADATATGLDAAWGSVGCTPWSVRINHPYLPSGVYLYSTDGITLNATEKDGYEFIGWYNGSELISSNPNYDVNTATKDMILTPVFGPASDDWLVWFDGTNGVEGGGTRNTFYARYDGSGNLLGANSVLEEVNKAADDNGTALTLPDADDARINRPNYYGDNEFKLQGWYNVYEGTTTETERYFAPGATVHITGNTVFYADWFPTENTNDQNHDYNLGRSGTGYDHTSTDTSGFITTYMFDYNNLFNLYTDSIELDESRSVISKTLNSEYWVRDTSGKDFLFFTAVSGLGRSMNPEGRDSDTRNRNYETSTNGTYYTGIPTTGILNTSGLRSALFDTEDALGKRYVGTGNYLYTYDSNTGYYYYDSDKNAATYNQKNSRFYLYNYRNMTNKSSGGDNADFLPFNYGKRSFTETDGQPNYWFGMRSEIEFFLPNEPGYEDDEGNRGNQSKLGDDMIYKFAGDDDVWVYVDDELILDMGGVHGKVYGEINFSTGDWKVVYGGATKKNDSRGIMSYVEGTGKTRTGNIQGKIGEGDHTLKLYYLERGSSQSNCAIYFNLAPKYKLKLHKTGVEYNTDGTEKSRGNLVGVKFGVYSDPGCTVAANVKDSNGNKTNEFVTDGNGYIDVRGLGAGKTYYIQELETIDGYPDVTDEVITLTISSRGVPTVSSSTSAVTVAVSSSEDNSATAGNYELDMDVADHKKVSITAKKVWSLLDGSTDTKDENSVVYVKLQRKSASGQTSTAQSDKQYTVKLISQYYADSDGNPINSDNTRTSSIKQLHTTTTQVYEGGSLSFNVSAGGTYGFIKPLKASGTLSAANYAEEKAWFNRNGNPNGVAYGSGSFTLSNIRRDITVYITFIGQELDEGGNRKGVSALDSAVSVTVTGYTDSAQSVETPVMTEDGGFNSSAGSFPLNRSNNWTKEWTELEGGYYYYVVEDKDQLRETQENTTVANNPLISSVPAYVITYSSDGLLSGGTITVYNTVNAVKVKLRKQDQSGNPLEGIHFKIYTADEYANPVEQRHALTVAGNNSVWLDDAGYYGGDGTFVTDSLGRFYSGYLPLGTYYIEEITPDGYQGLEGPLKVTVSASGLSYWLYDDANNENHYPTEQRRTLNSEGYYNLYLTNTKQIGEPVRRDDSIAVNKVNPSGGEVHGATFQLYSDATFGSPIGAVYTDSSFAVSTRNTAIDTLLEPLESGQTLTLYLKETFAPGGYLISDDKYQIVISKSVVEAVDTEQNKFVTTTTYTMTIAKWDNETNQYVLMTEEREEGETPVKTVNVVNTPIEITVVKVIAGTSTALTGAEFTLTKVNNDANATVCLDNNGDAVYSQVTAVDGDGRVTFSALPAGRYKLEETTVPAGYIRTEGTYFIDVSANGTTALDTSVAHSMIDKNDNVYTVQNTPGVSLPATGGPGTTIYYATGAALLVLAIALLLRRKARDVIE